MVRNLWVLFLTAFMFEAAFASCAIGPESSAKPKAKASDPDNYHAACIKAVRNHVQVEFGAALQYLAMGAYFARDDVSLDGYDYYISNVEWAHILEKKMS